MQKILIIGAGEMQVPVIQKAKELGYKTIVTDFCDQAPGFKFADCKCVVDTHDLEGNLQIAQDYDVAGVLTTSDYPVNTVAYICNEMGIKGISIEGAKICTNKYLQRKILLENKMKVPRFLKCNILDFNIENISDFEFPIIVKPLSSSGSRGVIKVIEEGDMQKVLDAASVYASDNIILIEEYINGNEYSVEILIQNGEIFIITITQKELLQSNDNFVEGRHIVPAQLKKSVEDKIKKYSYEVINVIGLDNTAVHLELKVTKRGEPILIEVGCRLGGDYITSDLVPLSTGVDMLESIIKIAVNEKINITNKISKFVGVQFITSENYNDIVYFLKKEPKGIVKSEIKKYKQVITTNSLDRLGYYIACANSREELLYILNYETRK